MWPFRRSGSDRREAATRPSAARTGTGPEELDRLGLHLRAGIDLADLRAATTGDDLYPALLLGSGPGELDRPVTELVTGHAALADDADGATVAAALRSTLATAEDAVGSSGWVGDVSAEYDPDAASGEVTVELGGTPLSVPVDGRDLSPVYDALLAQLLAPGVVSIPVMRRTADPDGGADYRRLLVAREHAQAARATAVALVRADPPARRSTSTTTSEAPEGDLADETTRTEGDLADEISRPDDAATASPAPASSPTTSAEPAPPATASPATDTPAAASPATAGATPARASSPTTRPPVQVRRRVAALVEAGLKMDPRLSVDQVAAAVRPVPDDADWDPYLDAVVEHPVRGRIPAWANVFRFPPDDTMADSSDDWIGVVGEVARSAGSWDRLSDVRVDYESTDELPAGIDLELGGRRIRVEADVWGALIDLVAVARLCEALTPKGRAAVHLPNHAAWVQPDRSAALSRLIGEY